MRAYLSGVPQTAPTKQGIDWRWDGDEYAFTAHGVIAWVGTRQIVDHVTVSTLMAALPDLTYDQALYLSRRLVELDAGGKRTFADIAEILATEGF